MFSPDRDYQPYYTIDHIKNDNLHFVTNLRKNSNYDEKIKNESNHMKSNSNTTTGYNNNNNNRVNDSHDNNNNGLMLESNKVLRQPMKESKCRNVQCMHNNERYRDEYHLRIDLQSRLDEATENLLILEEHLSICQTRYEETMTIQNKHQQKMNALMTKGLELKAALEDFGVAALSISREIRKAKTVKDSFSQESQAYRNRHGLIFSKEGKEGSNNKGRKHDGIYGINGEGVYAWTCCHSTSRNVVGCADDQSIGVKSNLPFIEGSYFFHNQLNIDHPLQHGSSLFVENNIKLHLMSDKDNTKSSKQQNVHRGYNTRDIRGNQNNNNSNNNSNYHDDAIGAKYLPTNSIIDFYSPNKSSEFITRCKTKNYETMGLKRPETASALRSPPHLSKLTSQVISHLDPRLHKYKTEMRLNDEQNRLQQQQSINNSFLVNVNTQSYSHSPSNNTIFKRRPSSANNLFTLSGSRPIDHKSFNNNNYHANNNNDDNNYNRRHSEANRNIASMLEASYNDKYNTDAPKSEVTGDINHQRPAVTSMSHKSIIGKTRVSTKQVNISKNRPLTSPDGFGIYY